MSTNPSFEFATVAEDLEAWLKGAVSRNWLVQSADVKLGKTTKTVLTYSQGNVVTALGATALPPGTLGVEFALVLSVPQTDPVKGFAALSTAFLDLLGALDQTGYIDWSQGAQRGVLESGEPTFLVPITVVTTYTRTTTTTAGIG